MNKWNIPDWLEREVKDLTGPAFTVILSWGIQGNQKVDCNIKNLKSLDRLISQDGELTVKNAASFIRWSLE